MRQNVLDIAAEALRASGGAFTRRNLFYSVRREQRRQASDAREVSEASFDAALRRRLARGAMPGLLPSECRWRWPRARDLDTHFPDVVLLVDRRAILDLFAAARVGAAEGLAVVCVDGSPPTVAQWVRRGARAGRGAAVLYLHDAATVLYPFTIEPIATIQAHAGGNAIAYTDLGLPPLGTAPRRFGEAALSPDELVVDLEAIPPGALVRYGVEAARAIAGKRAGGF